MGIVLAHCEYQPLRGKSIRVNIRRILREEANRHRKLAIHWPETSASYVFADLIQVSTPFIDAPLDTIDRLLRERQNDEKGTFDLFGAKIPAKSILLFGTVAILGCQFYLWSHLRELRRVATRGVGPFGYIGLYRDRTAKIFSSMTVIAGPVLTLSALWAQQRSEIGLGILARDVTFVKQVSWFEWGAVLITGAFAWGLGVRSAELLAEIRQTMAEVELPRPVDQDT